MADENVITPEPSEEDSEQLRLRVTELENLIAQKEEELAKANARISEMAPVIAESSHKLAQAVSRYRALVVQASPTLEELITGDTIEEIDASVEKAKALVHKVKQGLAAEMMSVKVPAGAPERKPVNLEALSPRDKIQYAIGGRK